MDKRYQKPYEESVEVVRRGLARAHEEGRKPAILFVCLGNICRSPAAEGVMRSISDRELGRDSLELDSAGFYGGHAGELPDSRMRRAAAGRGLSLTHRSRTVRASDFDNFDIIIGMDDGNMQSLHSAARTLEDEEKLVRMSDFAVHYPEADSVPDPYWDGPAGFENVLNLLEDSCGELVRIIREDKV